MNIRANALPAVDLTGPGTMRNLSHEIRSDYRATYGSCSVLDCLLQLLPVFRPFGFCRRPAIRDKNEIRPHVPHLIEQGLPEGISANHDPDLSELSSHRRHTLACGVRGSH